MTAAALPGPDPAFWTGRRVFVTGHTGFKGGWLCAWLGHLGADVYGYALAPPTTPSFFAVVGVERIVRGSTLADIRDYDRVRAALQQARPEVVFHLAAQPLVRYSYQHPIDTFAVNVMGVANLLDAVRATGGVRAVVNVTSDKCYEDRGHAAGYREEDPMGGHDPYSSSKGCAELITAAYRRSYLQAAGVGVATARAGNVIGGGDWAADRLIPDLFRAVESGTPLLVRSPDAVRPWQHVLEPVRGYLMLAERLHADGQAWAGAWNFGPAEADDRSVRWIIERLTSSLPGLSWSCDLQAHPHEAACLRLDSGKARQNLTWAPRWPLDTALAQTVEWYSAWRRGQDMHRTSLVQIDAYAAGHTVENGVSL